MAVRIITAAQLALTAGAIWLLIELLDKMILVSRPDIVDFTNRVHDRPGILFASTYDFIIVGAGSAGIKLNSLLVFLLSLILRCCRCFSSC